MSLLGKAIEKKREENRASRRRGGWQKQPCHICGEVKYSQWPDAEHTSLAPICWTCDTDRKVAREAVRRQDEGEI